MTTMSFLRSRRRKSTWIFPSYGRGNGVRGGSHGGNQGEKADPIDVDDDSSTEDDDSSEGSGDKSSESDDGDDVNSSSGSEDDGSKTE